MTPQEAIAGLDRDLQIAGSDATLARIVPDQVDAAVAVRAHMREYTSRDLAGGVVMGASKVVISPTPLKSTVFEGETNWPRAGDFITVFGRRRHIDGAKYHTIDGVLVRINLTVAG